MAAQRTIRVIQMLALTAGLGLGTLTVVPAAEAAVRPAPPACPPDWLGTTLSAEPSISANGRYVVFTGYGDPESGSRVIFLRDRVRNRTTVVSDPDLVRFNFLPSISADGTRISYLSKATDDFGNDAGIWVYDRTTGQRSYEGISFTQAPAVLDAKGRNLTFERLENGNTNLRSIYARDVDLDREVLVSAALDGGPANGTSLLPEISDDGRLVLFSSYANDLTSDTSGVSENIGALYLHNIRTGRTSVIPDRTGEVPTTEMGGHQISPDGRFVVYTDQDGAWRYDLRKGRTRDVDGTTAAGTVDVGAKGRQVLLITSAGLVVRTVRTGRESDVDVLPNGSPDPEGGGFGASITPSGRYVVFYSTARNLDATEAAQASVSVYVRDVRNARTELISTTDPGGACSAG